MPTSQGVLCLLLCPQSFEDARKRKNKRSWSGVPVLLGFKRESVSGFYKMQSSWGPAMYACVPNTPGPRLLSRRDSMAGVKHKSQVQVPSTTLRVTLHWLNLENRCLSFQKSWLSTLHTLRSPWQTFLKKAAGTTGADSDSVGRCRLRGSLELLLCSFE